MKKEQNKAENKEKIYKKKISLTNWGAVWGMTGIFFALTAGVFAAYFFELNDTFLGNVLLLPVILFAFWTLIEIILAIRLGVRIRGERVILGKGKAFDLSELRGITPVDGQGKAMPRAEKYRNPELVFHLNGERTMSLRISYVSGERFDELTEALGVRKK